MTIDEPGASLDMSMQDAKAQAAQVLWAIAKLLQSDDPQMPDPDQRQRKATHIRRVGDQLLADAQLSYDDVYAWDEWTANLQYLLGLVRK